MSSSFDLDRYCARIGYHGPRTATLEVLRDLQRLHPLSIPFENLNPLTGRRVSLALPELADKLIDCRRGGYCFELNILLSHALMRFGFTVTPLLARVLWRRDPNTVTARSHTVLRIDVDGESWIADAGFGAITLTAPLRLIAGTVQPTTLEPFRIADAANQAFDVEVKAGDTWTKLYRFEQQRAEWIDYEVANWYTSTHPESFFTGNLVVCRVVRDGRLTLFNDRLTERSKDGHATERRIGSARELDACLRDAFGIDVGDIDVEAVFRRVEGRAPTGLTE
ncbi:arylamine N-acetyltransferase family protein [Paraburkholderia rhizosphaerae]|uniref:N-hydroxyarylamine O-acetyltransferase n=1 Tax=Paraburkholderia rhizosphaerae TaxID=480658 RepID=A0A4R8LMT3_9BURK|nr:arylamine N-acetyltransferase [Paraburkholderia rhizosphaerae]TDY45466.1 N-hydroxyarylamine O-acetyltransferase [Paraburkholderia rhizosphaerae]